MKTKKKTITRRTRSTSRTERSGVSIEVHLSAEEKRDLVRSIIDVNSRESESIEQCTGTILEHLREIKSLSKELQSTRDGLAIAIKRLELTFEQFTGRLGSLEMAVERVGESKK